MEKKLHTVKTPVPTNTWWNIKKKYLYSEYIGVYLLMVISTMIITSTMPSSDHHLGDPRDPCSDPHLIILVVINV